MFDLTPIFQCVIIVLVILGMAYGLPVVKLFKVLRLIKIAVEAAEQLFPESGMGEEKKSYVLKWLNERGITYDADMLDALIESAVFRLNQEQNGDVVYEEFPFDLLFGEETDEDPGVDEDPDEEPAEEAPETEVVEPAAEE